MAPVQTQSYRLLIAGFTFLLSCAEKPVSHADGRTGKDYTAIVQTGSSQDANGHSTGSTNTGGGNSGGGNNATGGSTTPSTTGGLYTPFTLANALWSDVFDFGHEIPSADQASAIAVDAQGYSYTVGFMNQSSPSGITKIVAVLKKLNSDGSTTWSKSISPDNLAGSGARFAAFDPALALRPVGGVAIVFAMRRSTGGSAAMKLLQFDSNGSEPSGMAIPLIDAGTGGASAYIVEKMSAATDQSGNIYVGSLQSEVSGTGRFISLKKFDALGKEITTGWDVKITDDAAAVSHFAGVLVSPSTGELTTALQIRALSDNLMSWKVRKYNSDGIVSANSTITTADGAWGSLTDLALSSDGSIVLCGMTSQVVESTQNAGSFNRYSVPRVVMVRPIGSTYDTVWDKIVDLPLSLNGTKADKVIFDHSGNIVLTASARNYPNGTSAFIRHLSPSGELIPRSTDDYFDGHYLSQFGVDTGLITSPVLISSAFDGIVLASTESNVATPNSGGDIVISKLMTNGTTPVKAWSTVFSEKMLNDEAILSIAADSKGGVYEYGSGWHYPDSGSTTFAGLSTPFIRRAEPDGSGKMRPAWTVSADADAIASTDGRGGSAYGGVIAAADGNVVVLETFFQCSTTDNVQTCIPAFRLRKLSALNGSDLPNFQSTKIVLPAGSMMGSFVKDGQGNLFVAGITYNTADYSQPAEIWIRRFDNNGHESINGWPLKPTTTANASYWPLVAIDTAGNLIVAIFSNDGFNVQKLRQSDGSKIWSTDTVFQSGTNNNRKSRGNRGIGIDSKNVVSVMYILDNLVPPLDAITDSAKAKYADSSNIYVSQFATDGTAIAREGGDFLRQLGAWSYNSVWTPSFCVRSDGGFDISTGRYAIQDDTSSRGESRLYSYGPDIKELTSISRVLGGEGVVMSALDCSASGRLIIGGTAFNLITPNSSRDAIVQAIQR